MSVFGGGLVEVWGGLGCFNGPVRDAFPESREPGQSKTHLHNHPISSCYLQVRKQNGLPAKIKS